MLSYRQLAVAFSQVIPQRDRPVIAHVSLSAFGDVQGGAETLLGAMLAACGGLMLPAFTYDTMLVPQEGPPDNGLAYGSQADSNRMAEFYHPGLLPDRLMGVASRQMMQHPRALRSMHPILSFLGVNVDDALAAQSLDEPLAPIRVLMEQDGLVLLAGVDHTSNTAIHLGEQLAGRKTFVRWALTEQGVLECPSFPGSSEGFEAIEPHLEGFVRRVTVGSARLQAIPLRVIVETVQRLIAEDPLALLPLTSSDLRVQHTRQAAMQP